MRVGRLDTHGAAAPRLRRARGPRVPSTGRHCSAAARRWCWRSARAWARPPWRWPPPTPTATTSRSRCTPPAWPTCWDWSRRRGAGQPPGGPWRRGGAGAGPARAGQPRRDPRLLPRPVAQGPPPQAAADPAGPRRGCSPTGWRSAACCTAPPTAHALRRADARGPHRRATPANVHNGFAPRPAHRPDTRYEQRGLDGRPAVVRPRLPARRDEPRRGAGPTGCRTPGSGRGLRGVRRAGRPSGG